MSLVFSIFFASSSWHLAYAPSDKIGLATDVSFLKGTTTSLRCGIINYRRVAVSRAVAPVVALRGSWFSASLDSGFVDNAECRWPSENMSSIPVGRNRTLQIRLLPHRGCAICGHYACPEHSDVLQDIHTRTGSFCVFPRPVARYREHLEAL